MIQQPWVSECRKNLVCVDSYDNGVLKGRLCNPFREMEGFESLSQFLVIMERLLDEIQQPRSYTETRSFSPVLLEDIPKGKASGIRRGTRATFEVQVLFRQHTSWQGILRWREKGVENSFRSVLELILLMDSALRTLEGSGERSTA